MAVLPEQLARLQPAISVSRLATLVIAIVLASVVMADETLPDRATVEARLAALQPDEGEVLDAVDQRDADALGAVLSGLDQITQIEERILARKERVEQAPRQLMRLEREVVADEANELALSATDFDDLALEALEAQQREAVAELQQLQDRLTEANAELIAAETLPERAQRGIADAIQAIEQGRRSLDEMEARELPADDPRMLQHRVSRRLAELQMQLYQRELDTNSELRELAQQRRDLLNEHFHRQGVRLTLLQSVIDLKRRLATEQAIADAARNDPMIATGHPVLEQALQVNRELSLEFLRASERSSEMVHEGLLARSQLDQVRQIQRSLDEQIRAIRGSLLLSRILREQRQSLPRTDARGSLPDEIADLRLRQFDLARQRDELRQGERLARQRLQEADVDITPALVDSLQRLHQSRRELVDRLEQTYGKLLSMAIELQLNQQQTLENARQLRAAIDEQLFWIANRRPLDLVWLRQLPSHLMLEWREGEWRQALPRNWHRPGLAALLGVPFLLLGAFLLKLRRRLRARLEQHHDKFGRFHTDSQSYTPLALLLNLLIVLPGPLVLAGLGVGLAAAGADFAASLGQAGWRIALAWGGVAWSRRLLRTDGVAVCHFHWPAAYAAQLRQLLKWFGLVLVPVLLIAVTTGEAEVSLIQRPLALALLLAGLVTLSVLLARLILTHVRLFGIQLFRLLLGIAMALVPLFLAGLIVFGYEYTALRLVERFVITLYLLGFWILMEATVLRGLAVAARRLTWRRARLLQANRAQDAGEGDPEVVHEAPLDMKQINQQSLRLSKLFLLIGLSLLLYLVWSDLLNVLTYLERITIWGEVKNGGDGLVDNGLLVMDVFMALLIFTLALVLARNLPGLLEVTVLSRLDLQPGGAYAITSLLSYSILAIGLVMGLASLGVSWNNLQWLVAAFGVGLGFGLQEIFANFVSGLIIFFERPIRIGDTITLGKLTGTVSKIRIRATTVTDLDRKEVIVPNKSFVTDQLINWSLSDTVTRVVLDYGVAYGSDQRLVHRLLRQAADENSRVLSDPEPQVFFMRYGESSLSFELRVFVNNLSDRFFATDEINCRVGELFAEHELDIAFNQLDVWLHRAGTVQKKPDSGSPGPSARPPRGPSAAIGNAG